MITRNILTGLELREERLNEERGITSPSLDLEKNHGWNVCPAGYFGCQGAIDSGEMFREVCSGNYLNCLVNHLQIKDLVEVEE